MRFKMKFPFRSGGPSSNTSPPNSTMSTATTVIPTTPTVTLEPGDQLLAYPEGYKVSPIEVRELNELIRKRYALDIEIWSKRDCRPRDRYLVEDKMVRADTVLVKIMAIINSWDNSRVWDSTADWNKLRIIRERLDLDGGQRKWAGNPPWNDSL